MGQDTRPALCSPKLVDDALLSCAKLVAGAPVMFYTWAIGFKKHANELPPFNQKRSDSVGGDPNIRYYHSYWRLKEDEALVITARPPECKHWNFQLNNFWMESLDYRYYTIHVNKHTATYKEDGSVVVIVAHKDPQPEAKGIPVNWINTVSKL